jgi:PAS domain S-box-containing protein
MGASGFIPTIDDLQRFASGFKMRLLIVDDHEIVRQGVRTLILERTTHEVCGEAANGQDAVERARALKPDLIVMDVSMPRLNGLEATREIRRILPDCEVLILSQHDSSEMARQALKAGARGYVIKSAISRHLISAIDKVSRREYFFDPAVLDKAPPRHNDLQEILQRSAAFEKALQESEQRLRNLAEYQSAVMNNMAEGLYALDANGLLTSINRAGQAILGWTKDELLGKKMHDVTHYQRPDGTSYPASQCPGLQVVQRGAALREYEDTFIRKDGSFVPVIFTASPLKDNGKITGVIVSFRDDTEQRRAREELLNAKRELEISVRQQRALFHLADELHRAGSIEEVFGAALNATLDALECNRAAILLRDDDGIMRFKSWRGLSNEYRAAAEGHLPWKPDDDNPQPVCIRDVNLSDMGESLKTTLRKEGVAGLAFLPLMSLGKLGGKMTAYFNEPHAFSADEIEISLTVARQLAFAIERLRGADALRESDERLRLAQRVAHLGTFEWDIQKGVSYWSPELEKMYGLPPGGFPGNQRAFVQLVHPHDRDEMQRLVERTMREGEADGEWRIVRPDGSVHWLFGRASVFKDEHGRPQRMIGANIDITERKKAQQSLQEAQNQLALALASSRTASFDWDIVERRGKWNAQMAAIYGFNPQRDYITVDEWRALFHPDDRERLTAEAERAWKDGGEFTFEFRALRPGGEVRWMLSHGQIVRDASGEALRMVGTHTDITESKLREAERSKSEARFRAFFESSAISAVRADLPSARFLDVNDTFCRMTGYSREELRNLTVFDVTHPEEREMTLRAVEELRVSGTSTFTIDKRYLRKDGTSFWAHTAVNLVPSKDGEPAYVVAIISDINDRKLMQAELEAEANALGKLNACNSRLWKKRSLRDGLEEMLSATIDLLRADKGNIQLLDAGRGVLAIVAQRGFQQQFLDYFREVSVKDDSAGGRALRKHRRVVIADVDLDGAYAPYRDVARAAGYRAVISCPLTGQGGRPLGVLSVHFRSPHRPSDQDLRRLDLYLARASDFIQRCRVDEQLKQSENKFRSLSASLDSEVRARTRELEAKNADLSRQSDQLRALSQHVLHAQDEERRHVARELHDSAGQILALLGMNLAQFIDEAGRVSPGLAKRGADIEQLLLQLNREIRTTSYLLHPPLLDESGLSSALNWYTQGLAQRSGVVVTLDVAGDFGRLPDDMELIIFRLVQECLTNIHRHSGSKTALVRIARDAENVRLDIKDQGKGISPDRLAEVQSGASGVGIRGMQERLRHFRGEMKIESDGSGTCVTAIIPIPKQPRSAEGESLHATV